MPAFPVIVHEMLGRSHDATLFQGLYVRDAHPGIQQHILPVAFLPPAPTLVTRDVDDRGIDLPHPHGTQFLGHHLAHPVIEFLIERRPHGDALREAGGAPPLGAVQGFAVLQHRNPPAAGRHGAAGILVDSLGHFLGSGSLEEVSHVPDVAGGIIPFHIELTPIQELGRDLLHFLFRGETSHQVLHALFHRKGGVPELHTGGVLLFESEREAMLPGPKGLAKIGFREGDLRERPFRHDHFHEVAGPAISDGDRTRHRRERERAFVKNRRIRPDGKALPAGLQRRDAQHPGRNDGQRAAAPGMVHAPAVPVAVHADIPAFEKGIVVGMIHHEIVSPAFPLQRIIPVADGKERFHHVLFHVGAGVFLGLEDLEEGIVLVPVGQTGQDRQGVHPVVGFTRILRVPVAGSRPGNAVNGLAQGEHLRPVP